MLLPPTKSFHRPEKANLRRPKSPKNMTSEVMMRLFQWRVLQEHLWKLNLSSRHLLTFLETDLILKIPKVAKISRQLVTSQREGHLLTTKIRPPLKVDISSHLTSTVSAFRRGAPSIQIVLSCLISTAEY